MIPNVPKEKVEELLKDELFSRYSTKPGKIVGNIVACTGNQFCGFAQIETKQNAYKLAEHLESVLDFPKDVRMIWTGCPNSCAPVQVADVGLMGAQVKDPSGAKGMVPGVNIFIGGTVGPTGHLKEKAEIEKVALSELYPVVENVMIEKFGATRKRRRKIQTTPRGGKSINQRSIPKVFRKRWENRRTFVPRVDTFIPRRNRSIRCRKITCARRVRHQNPSLKR